MPDSPAVLPLEIRWPRLYLAVAMTTLSTLLMELSLTRIFSVIFMYHSAFLAISIALFGLGAGGVFSYVAAGWRGGLYRKLGLLSVANSILVMLSLGVSLQPRNPTLPFLALIYFTTAMPFFGVGTILSLAISENLDRVDRVYFSDLLGAACGCLLLIPLLNVFGGPGTLICAAILFAVAGILWPGVDPREQGRAVHLGGAAATAILVCVLALNSTYKIAEVTYAKGNKLTGETFVAWNSFSRIGVLTTSSIPENEITIDADASTRISHFDLDHLSDEDREALVYAGPGLPYALRPGARTLVIGPGGGWDVARALASGSQDVTGAEINPIIAVTIMQQRYADFSKRIYLRPQVHIIVTEGRSFVRRSPDKYQVLQATLVDTWASTAAGAFALSENNLYTTEAFRDYLDHLTGDGILCFSRWGLVPPRESLRLVTLGMEALRELGETDPSRHFIVVREGEEEKASESGGLDTVLISRQPFPPEDLDRARRAIEIAGMETMYLPGENHANPFTEMLTAGNMAEYQRSYRYDISPVTDDRPFFFYSVQPRDFRRFLTRESHSDADYKLNYAVPLLFGLTGVTLAATFVILALPPVILGARLPRQKGVLVFLVYFLCLGTGYILIEVALIQKFVLFLGHPTYALTVVVFSMLVSSGLGSYASRSLVRGRDARLMGVLFLVAGMIATLAFVAFPFLSAAVGLSLPAKIAISTALISPAGFAMGMPFPTGLKRLEAWHKPSVRWAWSLNSATSVLGSVGAVICGIYFGFFRTMLIGAAFYMVALATVAIKRQPVEDDSRRQVW